MPRGEQKAEFFVTHTYIIAYSFPTERYANGEPVGYEVFAERLQECNRKCLGLLRFATLHSQ